MAKTIDVCCNKCMKPFKMSAEDAHIEKRFNGQLVKVICPYCSSTVTIFKTPEAYELLNEKIKNGDYEEIPFNPETDAYVEEYQ